MQPGGNPTIAFLASGIEGIKVRITAKATDRAMADLMLDAEQEQVIALVGDAVFSADDRSMEEAVAVAAVCADSLWGSPSRSPGTGGEQARRGRRCERVAQRVDRLLRVGGQAHTSRSARGPGRVRRGGKGDGIQRSEDSRIRHRPCRSRASPGPPSRTASRRGRSSSGLALPGEEAESVELHLPGDRQRVRQYATISALDLLRRRLADYSASDATSA